MDTRSLLKHSRKISGSMIEFVELLQHQKYYLGLPRTPEVQKSLKHSRKMFTLGRPCRAYTTSEKWFRISRNSRTFWIILKNIWKLDRLCRCSTTSENPFRTSRDSRSLYIFLEKYLKAWETLKSFYNFRKII